MMRRCPCDKGDNPFALSRSSRGRRHRDDNAAIINLPQFQVSIPVSRMRNHIPGAMNMFINGGFGRTIDPLDWLRPFIGGQDEAWICELAMNWIFLHVEAGKALECPIHIRTIPGDQNPLEECISRMDDAFVNRDDPTYRFFLQVAVEILKAIGFILLDRFFNKSWALFEVYRRSACRLAPYITTIAAGGDIIYTLVSAMWKIGGETPQAIGEFIQQFSLPERQELIQVCFWKSQMGDVVAATILPLL